MRFCQIASGVGYNLMPCANAGSKPGDRCGYTDDIPCRLRNAGSMTFLPLFVPRTEQQVKLREEGQDRGHLLTESCGDVHLNVRRCRIGGEDCCCCCCCTSMGSPNQDITVVLTLLLLLSSDERLIAGVAAACIAAAAPGVAAAGAAAVAAAAVGVAAARGGGGPQSGWKPCDRVVGGAELCE